MRKFAILIVLIAVGYLAWMYREDFGSVAKVVTDRVPAASPNLEAPAPIVEVAPATPAPEALSPLSYYMTTRVKKEDSNGIKILRAGEVVKLMYKNNDGTAWVTTGKDEFLVKESQITKDPEKAEAALAENNTR